MSLTSNIIQVPLHLIWACGSEMNNVEIPSKLYFYDAARDQTFLLLPEVHKWVIERDPRAVMLSGFHNGLKNFHLRFSDLAAAILFKLTWGGN